MKFIKKNKDPLLMIFITLISLVGVILVFNNRIEKLNYPELKEKAAFLIITFSYVIFSICILFSFEPGNTYISYIKYLAPVVLGIAFIYIDKDIMCFIPYLLPVVIMAICSEVTIAYIFQITICIIYYLTGVFNAEISVMFMLMSIICIYFVNKSDSTDKYVFSGVISVLTYIFISYNYQLIAYDKVSISLIFKGFIPLIISIIPLYYQFFKKLFNDKYTKNKLEYLCHDENELFLSLMDSNSESYFHSLQVSDTAVKVAKILKCNVNLVNTAARYHEIGKIRSGNYVEEGIKIMKKNHFPYEVIKIVKEHNSKSHYPKTMESAIVMLSDSIEATLSKIVEKNGYNIDHKKIVSQIIDIRFDSGSLDYALKNVKEYKELRNAFLSIY